MALDESPRKVIGQSKKRSLSQVDGRIEQEPSKRSSLKANQELDRISTRINNSLAQRHPHLSIAPLSASTTTTTTTTSTTTTHEPYASLESRLTEALKFIRSETFTNTPEASLTATTGPCTTTTSSSSSSSSPSSNSTSPSKKGRSSKSKAKHTNATAAAPPPGTVMFCINCTTTQAQLLQEKRENAWLMETLERYADATRLPEPNLSHTHTKAHKIVALWCSSIADTLEEQNAKIQELSRQLAQGTTTTTTTTSHAPVQ
jgi:predicted acyl esterase